MAANQKPGILIIRISARIKIRRDSNYQVISVMTADREREATVGSLVLSLVLVCGWCDQCPGTEGLCETCETWSPCNNNVSWSSQWPGVYWCNAQWAGRPMSSWPGSSAGKKLLFHLGGSLGHRVSCIMVMIFRSEGAMCLCRALCPDSVWIPRGRERMRERALNMDREVPGSRAEWVRQKSELDLYLGSRQHLFTRHEWQ